MARVRMVTRTVNVTTVEALCLDVLTCEPTIKTLEITGDTYTEERALKVLKKLYETDTLKVVHIQTMTETEELYGMLETDFIASAHKLDPETRKLLESTEPEAEPEIEPEEAPKKRSKK